MKEIEPLDWDQRSLETIAKTVIEKAKAAGASDAEVALSVDSGLSVNVRKGEVETLEHHRDKGLGVTVYFGQRKGNASTADFSDEGIAEALGAACDIARYTAEDTYAGLPDKALLAWDYPDLDLDHPWSISPTEAIDLARTCEAAGLRESPLITNTEGAGVEVVRGRMAYANSLGFVGGYTGTRHSISCSLIAEKDGQMERDYWYDISRDPVRLASPEAIGRKAAQRTLRRLGGRRLGTRQVPVLFEANLARGLLGHFIAAIRGSSLYRQASFLLDHLGQRVFPDFVSIDEQPHIPNALGSTPFDGEGVMTRDRMLVKSGILEGYVLDTYSAKRLGMQTTGNAGGVHNATLLGASLGFEDLLKEMGTGLLVTELIGHGINLVTGDYSRGAAGFWVENGEILYPVEEITVAGNLKDMLAGIVAVGTDMDTRGNIRCGSILIENMMVAGE